MVVSAMLVACAPKDSVTTTTGVSPTSSPTAQDPTGYVPSEDLACVYVDNIVAIAIEDPLTRERVVSIANESLGDLGIDAEEVSAAEVLGASGTDSGVSATALAEEDTEEFGLAHAAIDEKLALIVVNADPMLAARTLRADYQIRAAPIHAVGHVGHYKLAPGTDADGPLDIELPTDDLGSADSGYVAVVDSGVAESAQSPSWLFGAQNLVYSASDTESTASGPSHGTFVAGLIRQVAPTHAVSLASARAVDQSRTKSFPLGDMTGLPDDLSTELHVFEALSRLIQRHRGLEGPVDALNLSLGTYSCDLTDDGTLLAAEDDTVLTLSTALQEWNAEFDSQVLAAAGNENNTHNGEYVKFWPAALSGVDGIAASSLTYGEIVWDRDAAGDRAVDVTGIRSWVETAAPGVDLLSIGDGGGGVYSWSGSSYGSAVAAGMTVSNTSPSPNYADVPGLSYLDSGSLVTVTTTP
jgi:hypothetical protein